MPQLGNYCKAYPVKKLRQFSGWTEKIENLNRERGQAEVPDAEPLTLSDDDFLYLQENFTVTDGIFIDQNTVFDNVTPEWKEYCMNALKFEAPQF
jgi:hypothetical protein